MIRLVKKIFAAFEVMLSDRDQAYSSWFACSVAFWLLFVVFAAIMFPLFSKLSRLW